MMRFKAIIQYNGANGGAWVEVPADISQEWKGRVPVKIIFEDAVEYRGSAVKMGGDYIIGVRKDIRKTLDKQAGDLIYLRIEIDNEVRKARIPEELEAIWDKYPNEQEYFANLSYSHQREYVNYIAEAKRPETRERRAVKVLNMLSGSRRKAKSKNE